MATSVADIRSWLKEGQSKGATHVLVKCDTFSCEDYPVFVMPGEDAMTRSREGSDNMQSTMECYALHLDIEKQLSEHRSHHYEAPPLRVSVAMAEESPLVAPKEYVGAVAKRRQLATTKRFLAENAAPKKKRRKTVTAEDPGLKVWLAGYAAALAAVQRLHDRPAIVASVMSGDGLTLKIFREAGVAKYDLDLIKKALGK